MKPNISIRVCVLTTLSQTSVAVLHFKAVTLLLLVYFRFSHGVMLRCGIERERKTDRESETQFKH